MVRRLGALLNSKMTRVVIVGKQSSPEEHYEAEPIGGMAGDRGGVKVEDPGRRHHL